MTDLATVEPGQLVVSNLMDVAAATGLQIPPSWRGMVGRHAKELFQAGFDIDVITAAAYIAVRRGKPQQVQNVAGDLTLAQSGTALTDREYRRRLAEQASFAAPTLLAQAEERRRTQDRLVEERRRGGT